MENVDFGGGDGGDYNRLCFNMTTMSQIDEEDDPLPTHSFASTRGAVVAVAEGDASSLNLNLSTKTASESIPGSASSTPREGTPRSLACPPKKAKPAVPRKPLVVLDPNLEQTAAWDESTLSASFSPAVPAAAMQLGGGTPRSVPTPVPPTSVTLKTATPRSNLPTNTPKSELNLRSAKSNAAAVSRLATPATEKKSAPMIHQQSHWEEQKSFLRHEIEIFASAEPACRCDKFTVIMQEYRELVRERGAEMVSNQQNDAVDLCPMKEERERTGAVGATPNDEIVMARSTQTPARSDGAHESSGVDREMEVEMLLTEKAMLREAKLMADSRLDALTVELGEEKHRREEAEKRVADWEAQLAIFKVQLVDMDGQKALLKREAEEAKALVAQLEGHFENEAKALRECCAVAECHASELEIELQRKSEQIHGEFEAQLSALKHETVELENKLREAGESIAAESRVRADLEEKVGQLTSENTSLSAKIEGLQLELEQCGAKFEAEKCSLVEQIEQRVNATMAQKDECFQNEIERLEAKHAAKMEEQMQLRTGLDGKIDALLSEQNRTSAVRECLEAEINSLNAQLCDEREKSNKLVIQLGEIALERDSLLTEKRKSLEELTAATTKLELQCDQLATMGAVEGKLMELKLSHAAVCAEKDAARSETEALATRLAGVNAIISKLECSKTALANEAGTLRQTLQKAEEKMKELSTKMGQQRTEWIETEERLLQEQAQLKAANDGMKDELAIMETELANEKASKREAELKMRPAFAGSAEKDALVDANAKLEEQLSAIKAQMEKEWDEFDRVENEFRGENFALRKEILKLKRELNLITDEEACAQLGYDIQQPCINI